MTSIAERVAPGCLIPECPDDVDPDHVVEMATAFSPYKELRRACPRHLDMFRNIGLPVITSRREATR